VAERNFDVVRRGLAEVWESRGRKFVTFEVAGRRGPDADRWVQFLDGELNVRWPLDAEPAVELPRRGVALPPGAFVSWHVAGSNAVIAVGDARIDDVARLVESLFAKVVAEDNGFRLQSRVDDHD
jgi:hypothetical protein